MCARGDYIMGMIKGQIEHLSVEEQLRKTEKDLLDEFKDVFNPTPHVKSLPENIMARLKLKNAEQTIEPQTYSCPHKFREAWQALIQWHLDARHIQPSSLPHASPAFIIPKADPTVLPQWINDYWQLNKNTVTDSHPLPHIDDILDDCTKGNIWCTINMTNSFIQTHMHPDDITLTVVMVPFGLFEWNIMPMGLKNAPVIHQCRVSAMLRPWIGKICHIYLDNIVIWSNSLEEHCHNIQMILTALWEANLYCNPSKTHLFQTEILFLGHHILKCGIEVDTKEAD